jgi:GNAT superfamily N-acetyltransferase
MTLGLFKVFDENEGTLLAMIHGTRTSSFYHSDESVEIGSHKPEGATAALHTLCVESDWRGKGLGMKILKEYMNRMEKEQGLQRISLWSREPLIPFYEKYCSRLSR